MGRSKAGIVFLAAAACVLGLVPAPGAARRGQALVAVGRPLPAIPLLQGDRSSEVSTLRGKPLVLNIWATWCEPCTDELGVFSHLENEFGDRVRLITVAKDQTAGVARRYLRDRGLTFPLVEDPDDSIEQRLALGVVPVTIVVDARGVVQYVSLGELDWPELRRAIAPLLAGA